MTTTQLTAVPRLTITEDDVTHWVCHCTDDETAACGLDVSDDQYAEVERPCPLCVLAWPDDAPTCPWGCSCDDECGLSDDVSP